MSVLHLLFPRSCLGCGDPVLTDVPFCDDCITRFCDILYEKCPDCSCPPTECRCPGKERFLFFYQSELSKSVLHNFKHYGNHRAYTFFGNMIYNAVRNDRKFDCVVFPPRSAKNVFRYGFDQMEETSKAVASLLGIPCVNALKRVRKSSEQKLLSADQRTANVKNLFASDPSLLAGMKRVLLLDDVRTTGSTMRECRKALRDAGIKEIVSFSICKTPKHYSSHIAKYVKGKKGKYKKSNRNEM